MQEGLKENGLDKNAMSVGMAFLHETLHTQEGAKFFDSEEDEQHKQFGRFTDENYSSSIINKYRKEKRLPVRYQYGSIKGTMYFEKDGNKKTIKYSKKKPNVKPNN